jgi:hypothetical protein
MLQILWAILMAVFAAAAATVPIWLPVVAPAAILAYLLKPLAEKIIVILLIVLAIWMAAKFFDQRGYDRHKAEEIARNDAAIERANDAEQQLRLCAASQGQWDARGRRCDR